LIILTFTDYWYRC